MGDQAGSLAPPEAEGNTNLVFPLMVTPAKTSVSEI